MNEIVTETDAAKAKQLRRYNEHQDALNAAADLLVGGMKEATVKSIMIIAGHGGGFMAWHGGGFMAIAKHRANLMKREGKNGKKKA